MCWVRCGVRWDQDEMEDGVDGSGAAGMSASMGGYDVSMYEMAGW